MPFKQLDYDDVDTIDLSHDLEENGYDESYNDDQDGTLALVEEVIEREVTDRSKQDAAEREELELRQLGSTSTSSRDHITFNFVTDTSPPQAPVTTSSTSTNANNISTSTNNPPADIVRHHRATFLSNFENQQKKLPSIPEEEIVAS